MLVARGVADLGAAMTPLPRPRDGAELVETGVYALVRHPIYGGLVLVAFGWALVRASIVAAILAAVLATVLHLKSVREERWLETRYPALQGTIRDHGTQQRRAFIRFFAVGRDLSHDPPDDPLPEAVAAGDEPLRIVGAMAGG